MNQIGYQMSAIGRIAPLPTAIRSLRCGPQHNPFRSALGGLHRSAARPTTSGLISRDLFSSRICGTMFDACSFLRRRGPPNNGATSERACTTSKHTGQGGEAAPALTVPIRPWPAEGPTRISVAPRGQ
jgi:hypothetical protein